MKHKYICLLKITIFVLLFGILLSNLSYVLRDKVNSEFVSGFTKEPQDSLDVIFFGSSMMYRTIYPLQLWDEYGIVSYNLGSSEQIIPMSYYLIEYAIEEQHPELIVLDVGMCHQVSKNHSDARLHQIWDNLPWSISKIKSIQDLAETPSAFYFDIIQYHSRWKDIDTNDMKENEDYQKGAGYYNKVTSFEPVEIISSDQMQEIDPIPQEYLLKIIELCNESDTELLLVGMPTVKDAELRQMLYNSIAKIAEENNVEFLNFFNMIEDLNISWEEDFADEMHLNLKASKRMTTYLGSYLVERYDIKDHRGETEYAAWDDACRYYYMKLPDE